MSFIGARWSGVPVGFGPGKVDRQVPGLKPDAALEAPSGRVQPLTIKIHLLYSPTGLRLKPARWAQK